MYTFPLSIVISNIFLLHFIDNWWTEKSLSNSPFNLDYKTTQKRTDSWTWGKNRICHVRLTFKNLIAIKYFYKLKILRDVLTKVYIVPPVLRVAPLVGAGNGRLLLVGGQLWHETASRLWWGFDGTVDSSYCASCPVPLTVYKPAANTMYIHAVQHQP